MGNKNSICPSERYIENIKCPICFEDKSEFITLKCGHQFDYYCLQQHVYTKYINELEISCPYCRDKINNKVLNKIFNKWIIINYNENVFSKKNIYQVNKKLTISKINNLSMIPDYNNYQLYIPLFYNKPSFLLSPIINDSNVLYTDEVINTFEYINNYKTSYDEELDKFKFVFDCYITDKSWKKFLLRNNDLMDMTKINNQHDISKKIEYSEYKIRFYITDTKNVKTIDNYNGTFDNSLHYFKNRKFRCLFKMYFLKTIDNIYLINQLQSIIYN